MRAFNVLAAALLAAVSLAAPSLAHEETLKVGVTAGPHAQILVQTEFKGAVIPAW